MTWCGGCSVSSSRSIAGYHSAHAPDVDAPPRDRVEVGESVALVHNASTGGLPADYGSCDVLYADLPWPYGLGTFNQRAAVVQTFRGFMAGVAAIVEGAGRPTFIVCGKRAARSLPSPALVAPIRLNQWDAVVSAFHVTDMPEAATDAALVESLAARYARVGDFCCGYGRSLRSFARQGKAFTGSDYNARCIGYIGERAAGWFADAG